MILYKPQKVILALKTKKIMETLSGDSKWNNAIKI